MKSNLRIYAALLLSFSLLGCASSSKASDQPEDQAAPAEANAMPMAADAAGTATKVSNETRTFEFDYAVTIPPQPNAKRLRVWIPLPMVDPGVQTVSNLEVRGPSGIEQTEDPVYGNRMMYVEMKGNDAPVVVGWRAHITRHRDRGQGQRPMNDRYLAPNRMIPLEGEAKRLASDTGANDAALGVKTRARLIYDDVLGAMDYDKKTPGWGLGDFARAVAVCKGNCTDFHARFTGVGRAAGIPVRFTMGIPMKPAPTGTYNSYHCWAHFHGEGGWTPVDISEADKAVTKGTGHADDFFGTLDPHRLALTVGRDLVLQPPQAGPTLQYFVFPYLEIDDAPTSLPKSQQVFRWAELSR